MWSSRRTPLRRAAVLVATVALLFDASTAHAQAAAAASTEAPSSRPRNAKRALVWAGASLFALSYLAAALVATTGYDTDDGTSSSRDALWVPVAGPFVMMGSASSVGGDVLLALDGLAQIGGLTMFAYGLATPTTTRISGEPHSRVEFSIAPVFARGSSGAAIVATF